MLAKHPSIFRETFASWQLIKVHSEHPDIVRSISSLLSDLDNVMYTVLGNLIWQWTILAPDFLEKLSTCKTGNLIGLLIQST